MNCCAGWRKGGLGWPNLTRSSTGSLGLVLLLLSSGCSSRGSIELTDTEGRRFSADCAKATACTLTLRTGANSRPAAEADGTFRLRATGRLVGICGLAAEGASPDPGDCRPVECDSDANCPPSEGLRIGTCINRLCVEPSHTENVDDRIMLCLAGTGIGHASPLQSERYALGLNSNTLGRVPRPCRQP